MHKTKKKAIKSGKIPKPIKIKKEKTEEDRTLQPMSHYVDDRLELVKQIFGTLKPKTITNLAPEFLKKKTLDEIEELCLNELLCISTKRLLSIINATKCPTDTESSEDSDVEHKEEHISLEEISSDSEIEGTSKKVKKKKKLLTPSNKNAKSTDGKDEPDGQISVLELLELQARARAIRSQLALEPVTKIEVDSDGEQCKPEKQKTSESKTSRSDRKRKSVDGDRPSTSKGAGASTTTPKPSAVSSNGGERQSREEPTEKHAPKKIKLKRNYRTSNTTEESEMAELSAEKNRNSTVKAPELSTESRSASPDVIPIQSVPETLLISDSSADEIDEKNEKETKSTTETLATQEPNEGLLERQNSEPEEGEITEKESKEIVEDQTNKDEQALADEPPPSKPVVIAELATESTEHELNQDNTTKTNQTEVSQHSESDLGSTYHTHDHDRDEDDHENDDVISIEGGDLETEMIEQLANDEESEQKPSISNEEEHSLEADDDIISLDTSEDDQDKPVQSIDSESWHSRYLKSSKVSQVLAASRLGKRVRDKIKKSKRKDSEKLLEKQAEEKAAEKAGQAFTSKHEDGSVEQYKELLELRQRKN